MSVPQEPEFKGPGWEDPTRLTLPRPQIKEPKLLLRSRLLSPFLQLIVLSPVG